MHLHYFHLADSSHAPLRSYLSFAATQLIYTGFSLVSITLIQIQVSEIDEARSGHCAKKTIPSTRVTGIFHFIERVFMPLVSILIICLRRKEA